MEPLIGNLLSSFATPAITTGVSEAAMPVVTDAVIDAGVNQAITGGLSNIGATTMGQVAPELASGVGQGMFSSLGNFGNAMMGDQGANLFKGLGGAYNAYSQGKALNNANDIQRQQLAMQQDAYNRDKTADTNRQKLVF
jgi:hypothetical protein